MAAELSAPTITWEEQSEDETSKGELSLFRVGITRPSCIAAEGRYCMVIE
jgi:hypothetical protein